MQEEGRAHSPRMGKASFAGDLKNWNYILENITEVRNHSSLEGWFPSHPAVLSTQSAWLVGPSPRSGSPRKCLQWVALSPASPGACFHMFLLHEYTPCMGWFRSVLRGIQYSKQPSTRSWQGKKTLAGGMGRDLKERRGEKREGEGGRGEKEDSKRTEARTTYMLWWEHKLWGWLQIWIPPWFIQNLLYSLLLLSQNRSRA